MKTTIDDLEYGQRVRLKFYRKRDPYVRKTSYALFLRIIGEGEDRRAEFVSSEGNGPYIWEAHRFEGDWAYGTSAERLELAGVLKPGEVL